MCCLEKNKATVKSLRSSLDLAACFRLDRFFQYLPSAKEEEKPNCLQLDAKKALNPGDGLGTLGTASEVFGLADRLGPRLDIFLPRPLGRSKK